MDILTTKRVKQNIRIGMDCAILAGMEKKSGKPVRTMLDRDAWIKAAIAVLAEHGADGLRVEVLAKRLGVTKGSFYWHFKDRRDLQDEVLALWKDGRIRDIRKQTQSEPGARSPPCSTPSRSIPRRATARASPSKPPCATGRAAMRQAAAVVEAVDAERLACACRLFLACGLPEAEAQARSVMLYAYVFGVSLMRFGAFTSDVASLKAWIAGLIAPQLQRSAPVAPGHAT
jgi:AcrR family transcriptional regulator